MQRRSFLKVLAGAACAVAAGIELTLPEMVRPQTMALINGIHPEWLFATYKPEHLFHPSCYGHAFNSFQ